MRSFCEAGNRGDVEACLALIAEGDFVVARTSGEAETQDGVPCNNTCCQVIRLRDGQFVEVTEYMDTHLTGSVFGFG